MNLVGNLEDLPLTDILQIVHLSRQTGTLEISQDGGLISLLFRQGKVVDASAPGSLARAFQLLQRRGLIDEEEALRLQREQAGNALHWAERVVAAGLVSAPLLNQAREEWIKAELSALLELHHGEFVFRLAGDAAPTTPPPAPPAGVAPQSITGDTVQFSFSAPEQKVSTDPPAPRVGTGPIPPVADASRLKRSTNEVPVKHAHNADTDETAMDMHRRRTGPMAAVSVAEVLKKISGEIPPYRAGDDAGSGHPYSLHGEPPLIAGVMVEAVTPEIPGLETVEELPDSAELEAEDQSFAPPAAAPLNAVEMPLALDGTCIALALADLSLAEACNRELTAAGAKVLRLPPEQIRGWLASAAQPAFLVVDALLPGAGPGGGLEIARMAESLQANIPVITLLPAGAEGLASRAAGLGNLLVRPDPAHIPLANLEPRLRAFAREVGRKLMALLPRDEIADLAASLGADQDVAVSVSDPMTMLRALIGEVQTHSSPEVSLLVLRLAAEYLERAVLLLVTRDELLGMGGFGTTGLDEPMAVLVRRIRTPLDGHPQFASRAISPAGYRGPLGAESKFFLAALGTLTPEEGVFLPITSRGKVFAVLYGDNARSGRPIGDLMGLEIFAAQAGIAMENSMLQRELDQARKQSG